MRYPTTFLLCLILPNHSTPFLPSGRNTVISTIVAAAAASAAAAAAASAAPVVAPVAITTTPTIAPTLTTTPIPSLQTNTNNYSCNVWNDTTCPYKYDGVCQNQFGFDLPQCQNGDCWDCDACIQFNSNCTACLNQPGCHWCPGDAVCYNSIYYNQTVFDRMVAYNSSCTSPQDYTDTCTSPQNYFR